uniref:Uncharacterized protein n=1 Tax=Oryza glumipatula TaxID=40148 RepID=A0A0E0BHC2_9ORYZ
MPATGRGGAGEVSEKPALGAGAAGAGKHHADACCPSRLDRSECSEAGHNGAHSRSPQRSWLLVSMAEELAGQSQYTKH